MYSRVYVEITNICNLRCSFCHGHSRKAKTMTEPEFARILQQLQGKTEYLYYHLMGEPLLHPQLARFLEMAKEAGFRSNITTNGTLLPKVGEQILKAGVHKVNISLHSLEAGDPGVYVENCAVFAVLARTYGTIVSFRLWTGKNDTILENLQKALPGDWKENTRGYRIREGIFLEFGEKFQWPDREAEQGDDRVSCYGMRDHFGILCDGTVVPCCLDSEGVIALGNVFTEELTDILATPRSVAICKGFQNRKATEDLCRRCGYARRF
ncbi:MAG: radical SAM protein [Oscillospiraceae bacterium]|nr:radical SAM protein [Oscillospiraceae bacterium]